VLSEDSVASKASVEAVPAVGRVKVPIGYVVKADVLPVTLIAGPAQPAPKTQDTPVQAGQLEESPNVVWTPPAAAHAAVVTSVQELEPASEEEPDGHAVAVLEPAKQ
jgi:hypothetical protein